MASTFNQLQKLACNYDDVLQSATQLVFDSFNKYMTDLQYHHCLILPSTLDNIQTLIMPIVC